MKESLDKWLIDDRILVAQSRYNLRKMKEKISRFAGASEALDAKIDELIALIGSQVNQDND